MKIATRIALGLALPALATVTATLAHTPVRSRYGFERDVLPVLASRCGGCHGGPQPSAPMSLLSYEDARPWAESIKEQVLERRMPPWYAEDGVGPRLAGPRVLGAREIDIIVDWAAGGAPRGEPPDPPTQGGRETNANAGEDSGIRRDVDPDAAGRPERSRDATYTRTERLAPLEIADGVDSIEIERRITVRDGAGAFLTSWSLGALGGGCIRAATLHVESRGAESFAGSWTIDGAAVDYGEDCALSVPAGSSLVLRIVCKKPWHLRGRSVRAEAELRYSGVSEPRGRSVAAAGLGAATLALPAGARLLGFLPRFEIETPLRLVASRADADSPLIEVFRAAAGWPITYWFEEPVEVGGPLRLEGIPASGAETGGAVVIYSTIRP